MPRMRVGVAVFLPDPVAIEIDGLRRALGDTQRERIGPHVTLVPPVNVRTDDLPEALRLLRAAGSARAAAGPLVLHLGPPRSFHPANDALFLAVDDRAAAELGELRTVLDVAPLARHAARPFVPHVTIAASMERHDAVAACALLAGYEVEVATDRLQLMEEQRDDDGRRRWVPIADAPFAAPVVVGRGGVDLDLQTARLVDPEVRAFVAAERDETDDIDAVLAVPPGATPVIMTARRNGEIVGVGVGWSAGGGGSALSVTFAQDHRRQGIARQLFLALEAG